MKIKKLSKSQDAFRIKLHKTLGAIIIIFCCFFLNLTALIAQSGNTVESISNGQTIQKQLNKGEKHDYIVQLNKGEFLDMTVMQNGVDVKIEISDPEDKIIKEIDTPNGQFGPELIELYSESAGPYRISVIPLGEDPTLSDSANAEYTSRNQGKYEINSVVILSASDYKNKIESVKLKQAETISSLKKYAHPLKTVVPGNGFKDLEFLETVLKNVDYVALGEATHGTKEFFQMKARLLEFLVKKMGFTVFTIEASYDGCNNINDYVLNGKGDAYTALASQGFWTWDTKEVIDMIEWMRSYNKSVPDDKKVKFLGFDSQGGGLEVLQNYFMKVDSLRANQMQGFFTILNGLRNNADTTVSTDSIKKEYFTFLSYFIMNKGNFVQKSSASEYENALHIAVVNGQMLDTYFMDKTDIRMKEREWRDYYMASNFEYLVQREKPGTKFVLWAHNGHVSKNSEAYANAGLKPMGSYLKKTFGDKYYSLGFSFSSGSFQAKEVTNDRNFLGLQEFNLSPAKDNSLDWYFSRTGYDKFIIDFSESDLPDNLKEFSETDLETRSFGALANRNFVESYYAPVTIKRDFDGMIFIDNTTRAVPNPKVIK